MKYTLLDLVQAIASSMDSDEVNSINDSPESKQIVSVIKTAYADIITRGGMWGSKTLFNLTASGDVLKPVLMTKPTSISNIEWLKYNRIELDDTDPAWAELVYLPLESYITLVQGHHPSDVDISSFNHTVNGFTFTFNYYTDRGPTYYTSIDDTTLIFDGYDSEVDTTLQTSKTLGYGLRNTSFIELDSFVPELQPDQFALLLSEAKALAWAEMKQTIHQKAEQYAKRNWVHLAKNKHTIPVSSFGNHTHPLRSAPNFGRK